MSEPANTANETLIGLLATNLSQRAVGVGRRGDGIDGNARSIWSGRWGRIVGITKETFNEVGSES